MKVNFNGDLLEQLPEHLQQVQRALYYGDALFESIRVCGGVMPLFEWHWERLLGGMQLMGFEIPSWWTMDFVKREIKKITGLNARVRLTLWRAPGGLYLPENNNFRFLITTKAMETENYEWHSIGLKTGLCGDVRLPVDRYSGIKTLNAARYVMAARTAASNGWDEGVLLNAYERVSETTRSNLFWIKDGSVYTPPEIDGCLTGIARRLLLSLTLPDGNKVQEKSASPEDLLQADELFLSNAIRGIQWVKSYQQKTYNTLITKNIHETFQDVIRQKILALKTEI